MKDKADIGVIGLAVMGQNLILNMSDHGFSVIVYNRTVSKIKDFLNGAAKGRENIFGAATLEEMVSQLTVPRKIMLMVKAGAAVDNIIEQLLPYLHPGDLIIDGGNSHFTDTIKRTRYLEERGLLFVGAGVSGGEEGARHGPSIMPGGSTMAWTLIEDIFKAICAKTPSGVPCCDWIERDGAGHYVKMIHNGIEYGDMQLISEAYQIMRDGLGMSADQMGSVFNEWNRSKLNSYLIKITGDILSFKDTDGTPLIDKILDSAGQKGTGKWASENALLLGVPLTLITEAVYSRSLSTLYEDRQKAAEILGDTIDSYSGDKYSFVEQIGQALLASKITSYAQGFMQMRAAAKEYGWDLDFGDIALIWREGCIIRSGFLEQINSAYTENPQLKSLLLDKYFKEQIDSCLPAWRNVVATAVKLGIPVPAFCSAISFYDGYRCKKLSSNMIQAQRDYFGAHTYERIDQKRGLHFHTNWTGKGGDVSSGTYDA